MVQPLGHMILLKIVPDKEKKTKFGLFLPSQGNTSEFPAELPIRRFAEIVDFGDEAKVEGLEVGDKVIFATNAATMIDVDNAEGDVDKDIIDPEAEKIKYALIRDEYIYAKYD